MPLRSNSSLQELATPSCRRSRLTLQTYVICYRCAQMHKCNVADRSVHLSLQASAGSCVILHMCASVYAADFCYHANAREQCSDAILDPVHITFLHCRKCFACILFLLTATKPSVICLAGKVTHCGGAARSHDGLATAQGPDCS